MSFALLPEITEKRTKSVSPQIAESAIPFGRTIAGYTRGATPILTPTIEEHDRRFSPSLVSFSVSAPRRMPWHWEIPASASSSTSTTTDYISVTSSRVSLSLGRSYYVDSGKLKYYSPCSTFLLAHSRNDCMKTGATRRRLSFSEYELGSRDSSSNT